MTLPSKCFLSLRVICPSDGANHDIQYLTITRSGCQLSIALNVFPYENGFAVSSREMLSIGTAVSSSVTYWVFPGNRDSGYCFLKLKALTIWFLPSSLYRHALNWAIPPL